MSVVAGGAAVHHHHHSPGHSCGVLLLRGDPRQVLQEAAQSGYSQPGTVQYSTVQYSTVDTLNQDVETDFQPKLSTIQFSRITSNWIPIQRMLKVSPDEESKTSG